MEHQPYTEMLKDPLLEIRIHERLDLEGLAGGWNHRAANGYRKVSAVMFLVTSCRAASGRTPEPCLVLNKRSAKVLQPGDLCCPGGGVARVDRALSGLLGWPMFPLHRWSGWKKWRARHPQSARALSTLLFTGLRESWEEMRLNPLKVRFLGVLPVQQLIMFDRQIYPLVGWLDDHRNLIPNWEVERIIMIPLRRLIDPANYGRFQLAYETRKGIARRNDPFPCYVHHGRRSREVLWGATFRIVMDFLKRVFGFRLPHVSQLPQIEKALDRAYMNGSRFQENGQARVERDEDF